MKDVCSYYTVNSFNRSRIIDFKIGSKLIDGVMCNSLAISISDIRPFTLLTKRPSYKTSGPQ